MVCVCVCVESKEQFIKQQRNGIQIGGNVEKKRQL